MGALQYFSSFFFRTEGSFISLGCNVCYYNARSEKGSAGAYDDTFHLVNSSTYNRTKKKKKQKSRSM